MSLGSKFPIGSVVLHPLQGIGFVRHCALMVGEHIPYEKLSVEFAGGEVSDFSSDGACVLSSLRTADDILSVLLPSTTEDRYAVNRVRLPSNFTLDVLNASCEGRVEIDGVPNIVWRYEGSLYLQECLSNKSVFYTVH